jgi:flavin-dependent dehydrogenase
MSTADVPNPDRVDVVVLGGGAAGLTLALQLRMADPGARIAVIERLQHPVPETTHKVGESTVEIAGHYLRDVLGLDEHLRHEQLSKYGLRIFFSHEGNADITRRVELGHATFPPAAVGTYQIDRGRLENALGGEVARRDVDLRGGIRVKRVELRPGRETPRVHYAAPGGEQGTLDARWVIDATGRAAFLKRHLELGRKVPHDANAVWFRIAHPIDIEDWSDDPGWHERIIEGRRELSTNHLMGPGYWVWMIRLATGGISIGIVTDPAVHPFSGLNRFDRALAWLGEHEPQLAAAVEEHRDALQDFRLMTDYSYGVERVFSPDRWCLTGESGLFLDPLYSPGLDLIAISNGLVADLVTRDLAGEDVAERAAIHDQVYLLIANGWLHVYQDQYPTMGNARVMLAKVIWDTAVYWAVIGLLYFHDALKDLVDHPGIVLSLARFSTLSGEVQTFFREWADLDHGRHADEFVRFYDFDFMRRLHSGMTAALGEGALADQFEANVRLIEQLSGQMVATVMAEFESSPDEAVRAQCERWSVNPVLRSAVEVHRQDAPANPISDRWICATTAHAAAREG